MRTSIAKFLAGVAAVAIPSTAAAETIVANDSVGEMIDGTTASARLIEDEMYEATFEIPSDWLPVEMLGVRVVMVKDPMFACGCGQFGLEVWEESAAASQTASCTIANVSYKDPGRSIFTQQDVMTPMGDPIGFEIRGDETRGSATLKDLRFSSINQVQGVTINPVMLTTETVRVGIRAMNLQCAANQGNGCGIQGDHFPVLVSDMDGVAQMETNFVHGVPDLAGVPLCTNVTGPQHYVWEDFAPAFQMSQPGDFVLRLILNRDDPNMPDPDMGMDMGGGADMGTDMSVADTGSDMSTADMGSTETDTGSGGDDTGGNNQNNGIGELTIESVTPNEGDNADAVDIVIVGTGFEAGAEVLLDAQALGVKETKSERIRATVDAGFDVGTYDLVVTNPDGETAILVDGYTVTEDGPMDVMGDTKSAGSDGCCSEVRGQHRSTALGFGIVVFLLSIVVGLRRREQHVSRSNDDRR